MKKSHLYNSTFLLALILGGVSGFFALPFITDFAHVIMELFLNVLKLISLPIIFLSIVSTLTQMEHLSEAKSLLKKILKYTLITTLLAATVGLALFLLIHPTTFGETPTQIIDVPTQRGYFSFLKKIIPENLVQPFLENNVLAITFIATTLSLALLKVPKNNRKVVTQFFQGLFEALLQVTSALIFVMPIAIFAFTTHFFHTLRTQTGQLNHLLFYALCVIGANLIQGIIILPLILKIKKQSPLKIARGMFPALVMAFFSKSSNAALPLSLQCAQNNLGISKKTALFSFPLCSVINMNGCAAFILITVLFVCTSQGISFTFWQMIPWIFISTLAAIGNAGVPMGCFFLTSAFLIGMGVSLETMSMILPLYALFDMIETALNVWSDSCVTSIVHYELTTQEAKEQKEPGLIVPNPAPNSAN